MHVDAALQRNIEAFVGQLDGLLANYPGKYVVFAHERLFKVCDTLDAAFKQGCTEFVSGSFLVQKVEPLRAEADFHVACRA